MNQHFQKYSVCRICFTRTNRPGKNSTWIYDLNHQHQKELSKVVNKIQDVPLVPKRVKLSEYNDYKNSWKHVQHKEKIIKKKELKIEKMFNIK